MVDEKSIVKGVGMAVFALTSMGGLEWLANRRRQRQQTNGPSQSYSPPETAHAPAKTEPRETDDARIREEGENIVEFRQLGDSNFHAYGTQYKRVEINGSIGKGLTPDDYHTLVDYLGKQGKRVHPKEEPHWPHYHERGYLVQGVSVTVPEPLGMLRVEGFPFAVDYVVARLMADHTFLKRPRTVIVK